MQSVVEAVGGKVLPQESTAPSLSLDECRLLLAKTPCPHRRLYYRVAIVTGLRCGELAALRVSQLDVTNNCLRADAETTKNRKSAIIPLPADLTASLAEVKLQKPAGDLLLTMPAHSDVFFKRDAENAGIVLEQPEGRATFHSLRKSTATILSEHAGASLPETQKLMRHSTPTLTSNTYTKTSGSRQTALVESLGRLLA